MEKPSVIHSSFTLERTFGCTPAKVFEALAEPEKKRRWFSDSPNHEVVEFVMDFREGGAEKMKYRFNEGTRFPGVILVNAGRYEDIVEGRRVVHSSTMTIAGRKISVSLVTYDLLPEGEGTLLRLTFQGAFFEGADGPEIRKAGWEFLMERLGEEVAREG
jgi:uncharacterized protein YndB with AHSA1/START domain